MTIIINDRHLIQGLRKLSEKIGNSEPVMDAIGRVLKDHVQNQMRAGGPGWPGLSPWTIARTGRTEPLVTLIPGIDYYYKRYATGIYYNNPSSNWNINQHHTGYTRPAISGKFQAIPQYSGFVFTNRTKAAVTPARKIWPTEAEALRVLNPMVKRWMDQAMSESFR